MVLGVNAAFNGRAQENGALPDRDDPCAGIAFVVIHATEWVTLFR